MKQTNVSTSILGTQAAESKSEEVDAENGSGMIGDGFEDEEDDPDAAPFSKVPAPLETAVLDKQFNCGPCR